MTRAEKKEELIGLFSTGAIYLGDLIDECFEFGQQHPNWISVEDGLPKEGDAILTMQDIQGNHMFTACQFIKAYVCRGIADFFVKSDAHIGISVDGKVTLGHVSNWMPLPSIEEINGNLGETSPNKKGGKAMTDRNTDITQAAHDAYPHETWIFIDGAHWSDQHPSTETINRIIELYKRWYSEQCDIALTDYIKQRFKR